MSKIKIISFFFIILSFSNISLAKEPSKQNTYDFRKPEEIDEEKAEKITYEKTIDDIRWVRIMSDRFVWEDKHKLRGTFDIAL